MPETHLRSCDGCGGNGTLYPAYVKVQKAPGRWVLRRATGRFLCKTCAGYPHLR